MALMDVTCFYTEVRNSTLLSRKYAFLPPHGRTLAAGETVLVLGDLRSRVANHPDSRLRSQKALETALSDDTLDIIRTPEPILYDQTTDASRMLKLAGGVLVLDDPCWESLA